MSKTLIAPGVLHQAAAPNPIVVGIVKALEFLLSQIITEPNAAALLKTVGDWINSLLGIGNTPAASQAMHAAGAAAGPFGGIFVKLIESLVGGMAGNPQLLGAILAWIQSLLSKTTP
jgi:hypothetical protein